VQEGTKENVMDIDFLLGGMPPKAWFTLRESLELKNVSYKTAMNRRYLLPKGGEPDAVVGGRNVWSRDTILQWIPKTDRELTEEQDQPE